MISIIGGGPIGAYTAYLLAEAGEKVRIFEEHKEIGRPIQCTGIVSKNLFKVLDLDEKFIVNKVKGARLYSPNNVFFEVKGKNVEGFILDREKFDKHLIKKAVDEGVELFLGHKFIKNEGNKLIFDKRAYETDILIGADGPLSKVAKCNEMFNREFCLGLQARIKLEKDSDFVELYMGKNCKNGFGWVVPENNKICRVGIMTTERNSGEIFNSFLSKFSKKIINKQAGLIPIYNSKNKIRKDNIFLIGDAAGQVKPTTGGGIVIGINSAKILSDCILNNKNYEKEFKKKLGRNMWMNLFIRKKLNKFDDNKYNELIRMFNKEKVKEYMCRKGDMDFPSRFFLGLLFREPKLLKFLY